MVLFQRGYFVLGYFLDHSFRSIGLSCGKLQEFVHQLGFVQVDWFGGGYGDYSLDLCERFSFLRRFDQCVLSGEERLLGQEHVLVEFLSLS